MAAHLVTGLVVASGLALAVSDASIGGIDAWKIVLAAAGFALYAAGRKRDPA